MGVSTAADSTTTTLGDRDYSSLILVGVLGITLAGAILRFYRLGDWSFWIEEHHSLRHTAEITSLTTAFNSIRPLFYLILKPILTTLGVTEWTARVLPAIVGLLTIPYLFWETRRFFGVWVAVLAAALLAFAPWHIYWSQNARFYTLLLLLFSASLFSFYRGMEEDSQAYIGLAVITMVLAVATHTIAALLIPIFVAYVILLKALRYDRPKGYRLRNLLWFIIVPVAGYIALEALRVFFMGDEPLLLELMSRFTRGASRQSFMGYSSAYITVAATVYYIGLPVTFLGMVGGLLLFLRRSRVGLLVSLGAFLPFATFVVLTPFATVANRYMFMALVCWIVLASAALRELYKLAYEGWLESGFLNLPFESKLLKRSWLVNGIVLAGVCLVLLKDPVLEDVVHYSSNGSSLELLSTSLSFRILVLLMIVVAIPLGVLLFTRVSQQGSRFSIALWALIFMILPVHATLADTMYFAYQDGHRSDWKGIAEIVEGSIADTELILTSSPTLASYYIDGPFASVHIKDVQIDRLLEEHEQFWFLEDDALLLPDEESVAEWRDVDCVLHGKRDHFVEGRIWKMRAHLCSTVSALGGH